MTDRLTWGVHRKVTLPTTSSLLHIYRHSEHLLTILGRLKVVLTSKSLGSSSPRWNLSRGWSRLLSSSSIITFTGRRVNGRVCVCVREKREIDKERKRESEREKKRRERKRGTEKREREGREREI